MATRDLVRIIESKRVKRGLSQRRLAELAGYDRSTISKALGHGQVSLQLLIDMGAVLGLELGWKKVRK